MVMNLATNAFHALREKGGTMEIRLEGCEVGPEGALAGGGVAPGPYVKLAVTDTGVGMSREVRNQIFDPYFTTRNKGEGTGLGLSVVHGIVTECGGHIVVNSEPGKGAAFEIYLPRIDPPEDGEAGETGLSLPGGDERLLLVDDEPQVLAMLEQMLRGLGYRLTAHLDGEEALAAFQSDPAAFDLVLTGAAMPGLGGAELIGQLKEIRPDIPVILFTGFSDEIAEKTIEKLGIQACLLKPLARSELAAVVREALDGAPLNAG